MPKQNKGKRLKIGGILLLLFSLLYIPSFLHWLSNDDINSDILRIGNIEKSININGFLVRDEVLLEPSTKDGRLIPEVSEGERIPAFKCVATISDKASQSLLKELDDVNTEIILAQNERAKKIDFFSEDIVKIDENIGQKVQSIINLCNINSMADIGRLETDVDKLIEKRAAIAGGDEGDEHIKSLKREKADIQQRINSNTSQIISQYSGTVSYTIDGFEQVLTPKSIKNPTSEMFKSVENGKAIGILANAEVKAGEPFVKVIKGNYTYIAAALGSDKAGLFKIGDSLKLRLNDIGAITQAVVTDIIKKSSGNFIIIKIDRFTEELSSMRKVNVDLIQNSYEGLKIPLASLYSNDGDWKSAKVMLIKANCASERVVEILGRDKEYAIIRTPENEIKKTISLYDTYILNPGDIKEGQIILR